jgi:luciferase family oxidoreductase group 1
VILSVLDRSRTRAGDPEGQALHDTIARARRAEELGYHRFWVAEHHAVPGIASGSPAVLLAAIGQATSRIRLGSGGVMLPQHQPFVVAEQFRMLEALYPGRVDLGIGTSLGFTPAVRHALRREDISPDEIDGDIREVLDYLASRAVITARPKTEPVPVHVLASRSGISRAARLGLPVVVGGPLVFSDRLPTVLSEYRAAFDGGTPHVMLSIDAFAAPTPERARELALPEAWAMAMSRRTGEFGPLEPVERILARTWPDRVRERVEKHLEQVVLGTPDDVAGRLSALAAATGADEFLVSTSTYDTADLARLDEALIRAFLRSTRFCCSSHSAMMSARLSKRAVSNASPRVGTLAPSSTSSGRRVCSTASACAGEPIVNTGIAVTPARPFEP